MGILDAPAKLPLGITNPRGLRRARALRGNALRSRFDVVVLSNSIGEGQGSSGNNAVQQAGTFPWLSSDNYNGWVGQLRSLLNAPLGIDPGEGFIFGTDPRVTPGGTSAAYQFIGPVRTGLKVPNTQTATLAVPASGTGVPACAYVGIVFWDQAATSKPTVTVGGSAATMFTTPGGSTALTTSGTGAVVVGYVTAANGSSVVVTGNTSDTYIAGFDLVGSPFGFHVHRMCQAGYVTSDLLGGSLSGALVGSAGAGGQVDRVVRSAYQWLNPGLMILAHWDVNDFGGQNITKTVTVTTTNGSNVVTITGGALDVTDAGKNVSGTGIPGTTTLTGVFTNGSAANLSANATASGSITMTVSATGATSGLTPALSAQYLAQFLNNTGGTASTGALSLGWSALVIGGPRTVVDGALPAPPSAQSAYIAAQAGIINTADANYQHIAALDLSKVWGSTAAAHGSDMGLQLASSVHPTPQGHGDLARIADEVIRALMTHGAVTTSVPT